MSRDPFATVADGVRVGLPGEERHLLVGLLGQLDGLLDDGSDRGADGGALDPLAELVGFDVPWPQDDVDVPAATSAGDAPDEVEEPDPALARLFPKASNDDDEIADEFRRLTETGLRARKRSGARTAAAALQRTEPVTLSHDEAQALLKAMTDLRLVLADRIGLHTDEDAEALHHALRTTKDADAPWVGAAALYEALTYWQDALVDALMHR